jgi:hypothetical protein
VIAPFAFTPDQLMAALKALGVKTVCVEHGPSTISFCEPCRVHWTRMAAGHLRDLAEGGDARDLATVALGGIDPEDAHIPSTLAEAAAEVDALADAIRSGDIS